MVEAVRVVWRVSAEHAERLWVEKEPAIELSLFEGLTLRGKPRSVFRCDNQKLSEATKEWTGVRETAELPSPLRRYAQAWFGGPDEAQEAVRRLEGLSFAENIEAQGPPIAEDITPQPRGIDFGGHLAPGVQGGVGAEEAWLTKGGTGAWNDQQVHVVDIEGGANLDHVELKGAVRRLGVNVSQVEHGTAVLGLLVPDGTKNMIRGLVPHAKIAIAPVPADHGETTSEECALWTIAANCPPGSVILLERVVRRWLRVGALSHPLPLEAFESAREAISAVVDRGINVVESAGNEGECLDSELGKDCGAILVGAINRNTGRRYSNYGDRVHLHSWGNKVRSCGNLNNNCYWSLNGSGDVNECYAPFGGTSCAAAIVAGVVASASGMLAAAEKVWSPRDLRQWLMDTGNVAPEGHGIGVQPDLEKFILSYV